MAMAPPSLLTPGDAERQLAARVRALRLARDWKQATLSERSGVSIATVRRFERGGRTSLRNFLRLCHALGRLDEFGDLLERPAAATLAELEARAEAVRQQTRRRGSK